MIPTLLLQLVALVLVDLVAIAKAAVSRFGAGIGAVQLVGLVPVLVRCS